MSDRNAAAIPDGSLADRRRSPRVLIDVPLVIRGESAEQKQFRGEPTVSVSAYGALVVLAANVAVGQRLSAAESGNACRTRRPRGALRSALRGVGAGGRGVCASRARICAQGRRGRDSGISSDVKWARGFPGPRVSSFQRPALVLASQYDPHSPENPARTWFLIDVKNTYLVRSASYARD